MATRPPPVIMYKRIWFVIKVGWPKQFMEFSRVHVYEGTGPALQAKGNFRPCPHFAWLRATRVGPPSAGG